MRKTNTILILIVILLVASPLFLIGHKAEFSGADDQGTTAIAQVHPGYKQWFKPIWEPPSGEVESFFFALQAAIGAGFIGYFLGSSKSKKEANASKEA